MALRIMLQYTKKLTVRIFMDKLETLLNHHLNQVEECLRSSLSGSVYENSVNEMCLRIVSSGGKRIRPKIAILVWYALHGTEPETRLIHFASAAEILHTATLVHDDVIDKATVRRGVKTLNETEGNHLAVLAGDYLFTKCFMFINEVNEKELAQLMNKTLASLVTGEINQLQNKDNLDITLEDYLNTVYCKTGALFELTSAGTAIVAKQSQQTVDMLREYGKQLGIAFQVTDDMLDYTANSKTLGKNIGEDLEDGRITMPLIFALKKCPQDEHAILKNAILNNNLPQVLKFIEKTAAIEECTKFALEAANRAKDSLTALSPSCYKDALIDLAFKACNRSY